MSTIISISSARRARDAVAHAARLAATSSPDPAGEAAPKLEEAVAAMEELAAALRAGKDVDRAEALAMVEETRAELGRMRSVLDFAAAYHAAWARILGSMISGYTPAGAAPLPDLPPRITVRG